MSDEDKEKPLENALPDSTEPVDIDSMEVRLFILAENPKQFVSVKQFLERRNWPTTITGSINETITTVASAKPDFILMSMSHPSPKVTILPRLLAQTFNSEVIAFNESHDAKTKAKLNTVQAAHKIKERLSGPLLHRKIKQILNDRYNKKDSSSASADKSGFTNDNGNDMISIKSSKNSLMNSEYNKVQSRGLNGEDVTRISSNQFGDGDSQSVTGANKTAQEDSAAVERLLAQMNDSKENVSASTSDSGKDSNQILGSDTESHPGAIVQKGNKTDTHQTGQESDKTTSYNEMESGVDHIEQNSGASGFSGSVSNLTGTQTSAPPIPGAERQEGSGYQEQSSTESGAKSLGAKESAGEKSGNPDSEEQSSQTKNPTTDKANSSKKKSSDPSNDLLGQVEDGESESSPSRDGKVSGKSKKTSNPEENTKSSQNLNSSAEQSPKKSKEGMGDPAETSGDSNVSESVKKDIAFKSGDETEEEDVFKEVFEKSVREVSKPHGVITAYADAVEQLVVIPVDIAAENKTYLMFLYLSDKDIDVELYSSNLLMEFTRQASDKEIKVKFGREYSVALQSFDLKEWMKERGTYSYLTQHGAGEVAVAIKLVEEPLPDIHADIEKLKTPVMAQNITAEEAIDFNVYLYLSKNRKYFLYLRDGAKMSEKQKKKLAKRDIKLHINHEDIDKLQTHVTKTIVEEILGVKVLKKAS